jgi:hypothetical protein
MKTLLCVLQDGIASQAHKVIFMALQAGIYKE